MKAVLITIGDEILSGTTVDTNSNFIAAELKKIGIQVLQIWTVSDDVSAIKSALDAAFQSVPLVITTGGLGPTKDDRTKKAFAEFFGKNIVHDTETFTHLKNLLEKRGRGHLLEINRGQAEIPEGATVFQNDNGTAPGLLLKQENRAAICLPGVPYEVKPLMRDKVIPFLQAKFQRKYIVSKTISVVDFSESLLSNALESWELALPEQVVLSYLPIANRVRLKLTATCNDEVSAKQLLEGETQKIRSLLQGHIISENGDAVEEILRDVLAEKNLSISVAESCTGGELSHLITSVPGSSKYFLGGIVPYNNQQKTKILKVSEELLSMETAVSENIVKQMALGCRALFGSDIALAVSGVAGPGEDADGNPQGLVFYAFNIRGFEQSFRLFLPHLERRDFMNFVAQKMLQDLLEILVKRDF